MANSLEARVPFLDHKFVELIHGFPDKYKIDLFRNKKLLRMYLAQNGLVKVAERKKKAFYFPMEKYMSCDVVEELISSTLAIDKIKNRNLFNYDVIFELLQQARNHDFLAAKQVFSLISLELWFQQFLDK